VHGLPDSNRNGLRDHCTDSLARLRRADPCAGSALRPTRQDGVSLLGGHSMIGFNQNKVALTILMGLALIGLFAVTRSGVAILAITRFGASFNRAQWTAGKNAMWRAGLPGCSGTSGRARAATVVEAARGLTMNQAIAIVIAGALLALAIMLTNHWEMGNPWSPTQTGASVTPIVPPIYRLNRWTGVISICTYGKTPDMQC
jgi:hypothetical protein